MAADLSSLTDAQLQAMYGGGSAAPGAPAAPANPLASMSDADLQALHDRLTNVQGEGRISDVPSGNLATDIPRYLGTATANVIAGAASLPRTVAQGVDWLGNKAGSLVGYQPPSAENALASIPSPGNPGYPLFPDFQTARDVALRGMGATEIVPQTFGERRALDATTGAIGGMLGGPAAVIPSAAGSAVAGTLAESFPNHPLAAAMLGLPVGAFAGKTLMSAPQRVGAMLADTGATEPYGAFTRQGLPTDLAGTATGSPGLLWAEKIAARMPGSEATLGDARSNLLNAWQDRLENVAASMGTASTPQEVGTSLQGAARDWLSNFKDSTGKLWQDFYTKVPQDTPIETTNYKGALDNVLGNFAGAPASGGVLQPGTVKSLSDALGVDLKSGTTLPWEAVKNIRSSIGEKIENPQTVADTSQAALRQIYGGLTRDMETGAGNVSPDALSSFYRANSATAAGHDLLDNYLNPVLKAQTPEQATQYAFGQARQGGTRLGALTFNLPSAAGDMSGYALRTLGGTTPEAPLVPNEMAGGRPSALATALMGRKPAMSPEAQAVLFPNAGTQADISDLATAAKAMQPAEKDLANSPTATHQMRGLGRLITAIELSKEGGELAGTPGRVAGFAGGFMAPNIMGRAAQATALNPYLSSLYGRDIPMQPASPSLLARTMMAPALSQPIPRPALMAPATSASSGP